MSFINSIFLFATAAAVLPLLYHLVRRLKAKTVPFSSLMFLKATPKELVRKRRLKDRLLMAARMALFLLLAFVFARPYLPAEELPFVQERETQSLVLLVDRSFSMQYDGAFDRAIDAVRERLDATGQGDEVAVASFADDVELLAPLETDLAVHRAALDAIQPSYRATDYFPALQRAQDVLQDARHSRRVVVLISDFQNSGWTGALDNFELDAGLDFETVPVGDAEADNRFVEDMRVSGSRTGDRYAARYDARIAALGDPAELSATLVIDDAEVDRRSLPSRTSAPVSFQHIVPRDGYYQGSLAIDGDALPGDDRHYFTDRAAAAPELLIAGGQGGTAQRDAFYLRSAFDLGEASRFRISPGGDLTDPMLRRHDVVFLANRTAAGTAELSALRSYVESGGTLVISAGDQTDQTGLARLLEELDVGRIDRIVDVREEQGYEAIIGDIDRQHGIFEPFSAGDGSGAILRPKFRRYVRLLPADNTNVVGRFDTGDVFLAERRLGSGSVLFYASTFDASWTDLPLDEMYVPFVYQLAEYGVGRSEERHGFLVGEAVPLSGEPSQTWEIRSPEDLLHRVTLDESGQGLFRDTDVPGHYAAAAAGETRYFSVNVDPRESDLTPRDPDEVYASVIAPPDDHPATPEQAAAAVVETDERRQKLWRILLLCVIALFAAETYFANRRTGKRKAGAGHERQNGRPAADESNGRQERLDERIAHAWK